MSMETFICSECHRQGCFTQSQNDASDWICKCGHSVQVDLEPEIGDTIEDSDGLEAVVFRCYQNGSIDARFDSGDQHHLGKGEFHVLRRAA